MVKFNSLLDEYFEKKGNTCTADLTFTMNFYKKMQLMVVFSDFQFEERAYVKEVFEYFLLDYYQFNNKLILKGYLNYEYVAFIKCFQKLQCFNSANKESKSLILN